MRKLIIVAASCAALASCQMGDQTSVAQLIDTSCEQARGVSAALDPWIDRGVIKGRDLTNVQNARVALFDEATGACSKTAASSSTLVRITSIALSLTLALRDAKKG